MVNFDEADTADKDDVLGKLHQVVVPYEGANVTKWIRRLEIKMTTYNIQSQWNKRVILENNLPPLVADDLDNLFGLDKSELKADQKIYKELKTLLLKIHGPRPESDFKKAQTLVMVGTPSQTAKKLVQLVCKRNPPLKECCCGTAVAALWRDVLPDPVKQAVANMDLTTNFQTTVDHADGVYHAMQLTGAVAAVSDVNPNTLAVAAVNPAPEVAAVGRGAGQRGGGRGGRGARNPRTGRGGRRRPDPKDRSTWGQPHADGPTSANCMQHWIYGKSAHYCRMEDSCPWAGIRKPPQDS